MISSGDFTVLTKNKLSKGSASERMIISGHILTNLVNLLCDILVLIYLSLFVIYVGRFFKRYYIQALFVKFHKHKKTKSVCPWGDHIGAFFSSSVRGKKELGYTLRALTESLLN